MPVAQETCVCRTVGFEVCTLSELAEESRCLDWRVDQRSSFAVWAAATAALPIVPVAPVTIPTVMISPRPPRLLISRRSPASRPPARRPPLPGASSRPERMQHQ